MQIYSAENANFVAYFGEFAGIADTRWYAGLAYQNHAANLPRTMVVKLHLCPSYSGLHTHIYMHTCICIYKHTHKQIQADKHDAQSHIYCMYAYMQKIPTYTHTYIRADASKHDAPNAKSHKHTRIHIYIHTNPNTYIQMQADRHDALKRKVYWRKKRHTCIHTYIHTYIHAYIHIHTHTYIHTYMHTCMHTYIHTSTHTYIQTQADRHDALKRKVYRRKRKGKVTPKYIYTYMHTREHTYIHSDTSR